MPVAGIQDGLDNSPTEVHYFSPRLLEKLRDVLNVPVTVLEAPSGYGKTTALQHYLKGRPLENIPIYWWCPDEGDPETSWIRLCTEFTHIDPRAGKELGTLGFPKLTTAWDVANIISGIRCASPCVLVLDDFQFMQQKLPRSVMSALLSNTDKNFRLVIVTQTPSPYLCSFFKQRGVLYIGADDLRLQVIDIYRYFQLCGMAVNKYEAHKLYQYTEGWIAAVYLTMLQMKQGEGFSPGQDIIRLMESIVWKDMPPEQKNMLLYLSLFPCVTMEQMQYLLQLEQPSEDLCALLEDTPFIRYEADNRRYVPHAILREMLVRRLEAADRQTRTRCYSRAGAWHARVGETEQALYCHFKVEDYASVLSLTLSKLTLSRIGDLPFIQAAAKLVAECPWDIKRQYPISLLRIAYAFMGADRGEQADALMQEIRAIIGQVQDENERRALLGEWLLISSFREPSDIVKMESLLKQAVAKISGKCRTLTADEPFAFGQPLMIFFLKKPGGMREELWALECVTQHLAALTGVYSGADVLLKAECAIYQGKLAEAEPLCHQAYYLSDGAGQWSIRMGAVNQLAQLAFKYGINKDLLYYIKALEESEGPDALSHWVSQMLQADYYSWRGLIRRIPPWINAGNIPIPDAPAWVKVYLRYAHLVVLLQKEAYTRFLGAAEAALLECQKSGYLMMQIYIRLLAAVGYLRMKQEEQAFTHVLKALAAALPDRLYLPLMELKEMLGDLVEKAFSALNEEMPKEVISKGQVVGDNMKLLIRYAAADNTPFGLTEREMEVATLAAKGMSNREIALQLFISESTVKYHLRTIFSKLDINRRNKLPELLKE